MKKSLLALVALGAFAGAAHAQSSVTLYGIIDEGFIFNNNAKGGHLYGLSSGVMQGSRFGLRGTEDLGGGLKAIFVLENGFDVNSGRLGQGGLMFGRQAYVGLSSQFGTVTLGRQYDSVVDYVGPLPSDVQKITMYSAGLHTSAKEPEAAEALVTALRAADAIIVIKAHGMEPG